MAVDRLEASLGLRTPFSVDARRTLVLAEQESAMFRHHWVGTEHVVLASAHPLDSTNRFGRLEFSHVGQILLEHGFTLNRGRELVRAVFSREQQHPRKRRRFTDVVGDHLKKIDQQAIGLGRAEITQADLLLEIVRSEKAIGAGVLDLAGVNLPSLGAELERVANAIHLPADSWQVDHVWSGGPLVTELGLKY